MGKIRDSGKGGQRELVSAAQRGIKKHFFSFFQAMPDSIFIYLSCVSDCLPSCLAPLLSAALLFLLWWSTGGEYEAGSQERWKQEETGQKQVQILPLKVHKMCEIKMKGEKMV